MPADRSAKKAPGPSTIRRQGLVLAVEAYGEVMVRKCSNCASNSRVCKVSVRSGKCSECLRRGCKTCDVAVTKNEFSRLVAEKRRLDEKMKEARREQDEAFEALRVARAKEDRLAKQLALNVKRAEEAIAVESRAMAELEADPPGPAWPNGPAEITPSIWAIWNDLDQSLFDVDADVDAILAGGTAQVAGDNS